MTYEEFPNIERKFINASDFQDNEKHLVWKGYTKKANEDFTRKDGSVIPWKQRVKYMLRYSYPEMACDEFGEKRLTKEGKEFTNKYWDKRFPQGYSIVYDFEEGSLESGSLPLFESIAMLRPKPGEILSLFKTGLGKETKWKVKKVNPQSFNTPDKEEEPPF